MASTDQHILTVVGLDRDRALFGAAALGDLIVPAANAVSMFEDGDTFQIDAYYSDAATGNDALIKFGKLDNAIAANATLSPIEDQNWVVLSQAALPPVCAGRFTICGSHDLHRVPAGPNTILIEASEAFGTAHHATTYGCLVALDNLTRRATYNTILDLGTGSGVLALALARALPKAKIMGSDNDPRSIEVAIENAARNGLGAYVHGPSFIVADGLDDPRIRQHAPFNLITANILAKPLIQLAPAIVRSLATGGVLVLSGILVPQAREVCARYAGFGLNLIRHDRHHGWSTLTFRVGSLRKSASNSNRRASTTSADAYNLYKPQDD